MAFFRTDGFIGGQNIADTSATQLHPLGTICKARDNNTVAASNLGEGEFIYLLGVASTIVGSLVTYDPFTYQTALAPVGANLPRPIAVAMSANVAGQYGWYQISGIAVVAKTATISLAAGAAVGVKTVGLIASSGTGKELQGALVAKVASNVAGRTTVQVMINRPHMQGRIT